ncbi:ribosome maturation factor RimP [Corynebacterium endometrii]|uniref:ribosome maturation factor RimP n=1 Tax=Corynebacterium endometrii TaxID=2488819 RepID=UPI00109C3E7B|nr:ribosome maturation factor RimP [Corynebacterium endometrii]
MAFPESQQLHQLLEGLLSPQGIDVEDVKTTKAGKKSQVIIRLDSESRPSSDDLERLSGEIGAFFDAKEAAGELNFGAGYTLEVSTPGVDLPLTAPRHWRRNRGRAVAVEHVGEENKPTLWRIGALSDDEQSVTLIRSEKRDIIVRQSRLENIARAVVEIEFSQPPAAEAEVAAQDFNLVAKEYLARRED